jgi:hypothetical protein
VNLKKARARRAANARHRALMTIASHVIARHVRLGDTSTATAEVIAIAFGRHQLRITDDEALDYLNAQLAERSLPLCPQTTARGDA